MAALALPSQAQNLSEVEFWFDQAVDERQSMAVSGQDDSVLADIPTAGLTAGLHWLNIRVKDTDGMYSGVSSSPFLKFEPMNSATVEYWIDDDYAGRRTESLSGGAMADGVTAMLDMDGFPMGFHRLNYRVFTESGSSTAASVDFVMNEGKGNSDRIEYWIDDDLRRSRMSDAASVTDSCISLDRELDLSDVPVGLHRLYYRTCSNERTNLGALNIAYVMVNSGLDPEFEFWLDGDTTHIYAMPASVHGNTTYVDGFLDLSGSQSGFHQMSYRLSSSDHRYTTAVCMSPILVMPIADHCVQQEETEIVQGLYWVDDSEPLEFSELYPGMEIDIEQLVNAASLEDGEHVLSMMFKDSNGRWSGVDKTVFLKLRYADTQTIAGIIYRYTETDDESYALAIGYEDNVEVLSVLPSVSFGEKTYQVTYVEDNAFYGCFTADSVAFLPASLERIGDKAFAYSSVSEINLKASSAPVFGTDALPPGSNLRVPVAASGYETIRTVLENQDVWLTYDESCIREKQWNALKRIDAKIRDNGGNSGWSFTDRSATPSGVYRFGTDDVREIDLSGHGLTGDFDTYDWMEDLHHLSRVNLEHNSITDMTGKDGYGIMHLDSQIYVQSVDIRVSEPDADALYNPDVRLLFRDANTGELGNPSSHDVSYLINPKAPDGSFVSDLHEDVGIVMTVSGKGNVTVSPHAGNLTNVYHGVSGQTLSASGFGIQSLSPNSHFTAQLFFDNGDIDLNGIVNVSDLQRVINHIFNEDNVNGIFAWNAANVVADDRINVMDVVGVVNILLSQMSLSAKPADAALEINTSDTIEVESSDVVLLTVRDNELELSCSHDVAALDIVLERESDFSALKTDFGMTVSRRIGNDGREHIVAYSLDGKYIPAGVHRVAQFSKGNTVLSVSSAAADATMLNTGVIDMSSGLTGVESIESDEDDGPLYDLSGRPVNRGVSTFYIKNGDVIMNTDMK